MAGHQELNRNTSGNNEPHVPADKSLPEAPPSQASQPQTTQDKDKELNCDKIDKSDAIDRDCEQVANKSSARPDEKHHVEHDDRAISTAISDKKEEHHDDDIAIEEGEENTCRSTEAD